MRVLLDTHVLLWWLGNDAKLAAGLRAVIADGGNDILYSAVSIAEIAIKQSQGRLDAPPELVAVLAEEGMTELPLNARHADVLRELPWHHRDPFDRMLIAQAQVEELEVATVDPAFALYDLRLV